MPESQYIAIDLKSFYASVECVSRGLDPLDTNLVVADLSRTEKTICLAVTPALKQYGIPGRIRLFEVISKVKELNALRKLKAPGREFSGVSHFDHELKADPSLGLDYIVAPPRMALYMKTSAEIYEIYLKYIAPEDIHVYSVDEVFIDATRYLKTYGMSARELAMTMIKDVLKTTGITATAGIGTNMYLCKIAMDIIAKHVPADENGVRIAELDELSYREKLWDHRPLTDFWRLGNGYARRLESAGIYTMYDVARCSLYNEDRLYRMFGINAELLIDHAWGWEPCTIADVKAYRPQSNSISMGQVLKTPYNYEKGRLIVREMTDLLSLDLTDKGAVCDQLTVTIGYDVKNLSDPGSIAGYSGKIVRDPYGRLMPGHSHGTVNLTMQTSSTRMMTEAALSLYDRIINRELLIRRVNIAACRVVPESSVKEKSRAEQLDMFTDYGRLEAERNTLKRELDREKRIQKAMISIRKKHGKNAILRGMNFEDGATTRERQRQIGGHNA